MIQWFLGFYDLVFFVYFICVAIPFWVVLILGLNLCGNYKMVFKTASESYWLEWGWTIAPLVLVAFLCFLNLAYSMENPFLLSVCSSAGLIKVIGHQWYWTYEDNLFGGYYDSMITDFVGSVDKPLRLVWGNFYKFVVTSDDVIHSFALPDFCFKLDAIPGRASDWLVFADRCGVFVGYCSELCGAGHAYMPIVMEIVRGK
nr:cytochrome c oxidase subunit II [Strigea falconis]